MRIAVLCNDKLGLPALQQLVQNQLVCAVGTSDRSPEMIAVMKQVRTQAGIPVKVFSRGDFESDLINWLKSNLPDVVLVKTFPFRIPASALSLPKYGFINFHYAPLPEYRGPNPLFWMIRNGITKGGISIHKMDEQFDSGPVLMQRTITLSPDATFGMWSSQLGLHGMQMTAELLHQLFSGQCQSTEQVHQNSKWYGRPRPIDFQIDWKVMSAREIKSLALACNPWAKGAWTSCKGGTLAITDADISKVPITQNIAPGTIIQLSPADDLVVACTDHTTLCIKVLYTDEGFFEGRKLAQTGIKPGDRFV